MPRLSNFSAKLGRMPVDLKTPLTRPFAVHAGLLEAEDVLHRDDLAFHAGDLADVRQLAGAVGQTAESG